MAAAQRHPLHVRRRMLITASLALGAPWLGARALAQSAPAEAGYPVRPLRIVVPYPPGAINDILARAVADRLQAALGQPVIVDNRGGGGAVIGTQAVAAAAPDGYTLLQVPAAHVNNASLLARLPYDSLGSFRFITLAARSPLLLVASDRLQVRSLPELLAAARRQPGMLAYGSSGNGGAAHVMGEMLKQMAGIEVLHVPYKGAAAAMTDLMGGRLHFTFATPAAAGPAVQAGRARILAVTTRARWSLLPEVPTIAEEGLAQYDAAAWWGYAAPAGTPDAIVARLNREINAALRQPALRSALAAEGIEPLGTTPQQFAAFVQAEIPRWAEVIRRGGIRAE